MLYEVITINNIPEDEIKNMTDKYLDFFNSTTRHRHLFLASNIFPDILVFIKNVINRNNFV